MKKSKVFHGCSFLKNVAGQVDILIATSSQKRVSELTGLSLGTIKNYFSQTGNKETIEIATAKHETIFYRKKNSTEWIEYIKGKEQNEQSY